MTDAASLPSLLAKAAALQRAGDLAAAEAVCRRVLEADPRQVEALERLAQMCCQTGRFAAGVAWLRQVVAIEPGRARAHVLLGRALAELGQAGEALASLDTAVGCDPRSADALGSCGDLLAQLGRLEDAIVSYRQALALAPASPTNWCNLAAAEAESGALGEAQESFTKALALDPQILEARIGRASVAARLGRAEDALADLDAALALAPDCVPALVLRGDLLRGMARNDDALAVYARALALAGDDAGLWRAQAAALVALGRKEEALASLERALAIAPADAESLSNRGFLLHALRRFDAALAAVDKALAIEPDHVEALINRGVLLSDLGRHLEAAASFERAVATSPANVRARCNYSRALFALNRYGEALEQADAALTIDAAHVDSIYIRGLNLARLQRHDEAIPCFERILSLVPGHPHARALLAASCLATCSWDKVEMLRQRLYDDVAAGTAIVAPHILLQLGAPPPLILDSARRYLEHEVPAAALLPAPAVIAPATGKIRVAYLSGDFRVHPIAYLTGELFERHDRRRFEVIGVSLGPDDGSAERRRIVAAFDAFHDVRAMGDRDVALQMRQLGIDIAVDLGGHTDHARPGILRYRPAPVQVNYLGFAGTIGADFIDYILADAVALPFDQQPYYAERIVHLPECFLVNDTRKPIADRGPTRVAAGLPEHGFVFCCFNNAYKISAEIFRLWMRLLGAIEGSVLWLSQMDRSAAANLRAAANAAGIDPARLVFAAREPVMADHLVRQRLADLFLDTPGYNAHTTASDALWAGLPVLTCLGSTFAGRVAASLLHAIGLPDLVVGSLADYEALALRLARDPALLADYRRRLEHNRHTTPLFDTASFTRGLESAYATMIECARAGRPPRSFSVMPSDRAV